MLVLKYGLNPSYVLDEMQWYEVNGLLKYEYFKNQEKWEQTRFMSYIIAQVNSKKKLKFDDIITFPWENENDKTTTSKEEFERLKNKAKEYIKNARL